MNVLSTPIYAVCVAAAAAVATGVGSYLLIDWIVAQDWALSTGVFGSGMATEVDPTAGPLGAPMSAAAGNAAAARDDLLKMLNSMIALVAVVVLLGPLVWIAWFSRYKSAGYKEDGKGLPLWFALLLVTVGLCIAIVAFAVFGTPPGENLSARGGWWVAATLVALPLLAFVLITRMVTPNWARTSMPI